jgi:hypothetical protein
MRAPKQCGIAIHRTLLLGVALAALIETSGCETLKVYPGPPRSANEIATLVLPFYDAGFPGLRVHQIDNMPVSSAVTSFALLPATHEILISCGYSQQLVTEHSYGRERLRFHAKAGHVYKVRTRVRQGRCMMWVEDKVGQETVSEPIARCGRCSPAVSAHRQLKSCAAAMARWGRRLAWVPV